MRGLLLLCCALWSLCAACASPHLTDKDLQPLNREPLRSDSDERIMNSGDLSEFFSGQTKGIPLKLVSRSGKVMWGRFSSFDDFYQTVWIIPEETKGLFSRTPIKLSTIRNVSVMAKPEEKTFAPLDPANAGF